MAIATDFEVQASKNIRYVGAAHGVSGAGYYTVLELHRWLGSLADDASATGDDLHDMSKPTASERAYDTIITLKNGYNIDATASEHLYGGSIIQGSGGTEEIWDGLQVIAGSGAHVEIVQDGTLITNDFWNSVPFGTGLKGLNPDASNGVSHRFILKVRSAGADIEGRRLLLQTRELGFTFSEFKINGTGRGVNVAALNYATDLNNQTAEGTISGWTGITNTVQGYTQIDVNNDTVNENYYSKWDKAAYTISQFYERMKWMSRRGSASTLYGLNGELFRGITHEITTDTPTGTFSAFEAVSWSGGSGQMLALNSPTAPTKMWIQLIKGVPPTDNQVITGGTSSATCQVNTTVTERPLSFPFCGVSTGSALIGAYGLGIEAADLNNTDKLFDLTNTQRTPPTQAQFSVKGLTIGEDSVLVGPATGSALNTTQFTLSGTLNGAAVTSVVVTQAIPADTPPSGTLRIVRNNGADSKHIYSAFNAGTKTFTIASHNFASNPANAGNGVYITYIDKVASVADESFTLVFDSNRDLYVLVRDGGATPIKDFQTTATLTSTGGSVTVIHTSDA